MLMRVLRSFDRVLRPAARVDPEKARQARLLVAVVVFAVPMLLGFALRQAVSLGRPLVALPLTLAALFVACVPLVLRLSSSPTLAGYLLALAVLGGTTTVSVLRGGFVTQALAWNALIPVASAVLHQRRHTYLLAGLVGGTLIVLHLLAEAGVAGMQLEPVPGLLPLLGTLASSTLIGLAYESGIAQLRRQKERLEVATMKRQRLASLGHLAAGVAHDFNNVLSIVQLSSCNLENGADDATRNELALLRDAVARGAFLTSQLLDFARERDDQAHAFELRDMLRAVEPLVRRLVPESIAVTFEPPAADCWVMGSRREVEHLLLNMSANARDAMPDGGTLRIVAGRERIDEAPGRAQLQPGSYGVLSISDSGAGIHREDLPHVFEPFFTTKAREHGTGLGLALGYKGVRGVGGDVRVRSEPGSGAQFEILLPETEVPASLPDVERRANCADRGAATVLVVDDQRSMVKAASRFLRGEGYEVLTAHDGAEALSALQRVDWEVDVIVTDVIMPHVGGGELAQRVRRMLPGIAVIYMSGYSDDAQISREVEAGMAQFIAKPFDPHQLVELVEASLHPGRTSAGRSGRRRSATAHATTMR